MPSSDSDSSEADGEKCAICLKKFKKQRIGNPSKCDHSFCLHCLQEWSKVRLIQKLIFLLKIKKKNRKIVELINLNKNNHLDFP